MCTLLEAVDGTELPLNVQNTLERRCTGGLLKPGVMGTRGLGDRAQVFLGSTTYQVVQLAEAPVTLAR
jgi:hypothetical protein